MKILKVLKRDLKNVRKNKVALGIIIGLCIIPSLYTWITLKANWNPYVDTGNVPVAVVNEDNGTIINNKIVNFGKQTVDQLKNNDSMKWVFVGPEVAEQGLKDGTYYSEIIIPSDFSQDLQTIFSGNPIKPNLIYRVNDKTNAIAAKISDLAVNQLQVQIKQNFFESLDKILLNYANSLGSNIKDNQSLIVNLKNIVATANNNVNSISGNINSSEQSVQQLTKYLETIKNDIPNISKQIDGLQGVITSSKSLLQATQNNVNNIQNNINSSVQELGNVNNSLNNFIQDLENTIKTQENINSSAINGAQNGENAAKNNVDNAGNAIVNDGKKIASDANSMKLSKEQIEADKKKLQDIIGANKNLNNVIDTVANLLNTLNNIDNTPQLNNLINIINNLKQNGSNQLNELQDLNNYLSSQNSISANDLNSKLAGIKTISSNLTNDINQLNSSYANAINSFVTSMNTNLNEGLNSADNILESSKAILPALQSIANMGITTSNLTVQQAQELQQKLNSLNGTLNNLKASTDKLNNEALNNLTNLLDKNPNEFSKLFSSPIGMKIEELYGMSVFGVGLAPFYTVLSIWVGALLCTTMISTIDRKKKNQTRSDAISVHFARLILFIGINFIQGTIVSLGDVFILGIKPANFWLFMGFTWLTGIVFTVLIFTLVSLMGNFGKAAALVIMVIQVAGSSAIYPIQVNPEFFQKLEPLWPVTYAVDGFRQAIGSPDWTEVAKDVKFLLLFLVIFLVLGLGRMFSYPIAQWVEKQFGESKL